MSPRLLPWTSWCYLLPVTVCLLEPPPVWAKDQTLTDDAVEIRENEGHRLLLPKDWPVEHKDGRSAPIAIEAYLSMKFDQVKTQFATIERHLDGLDRRLERLEQDSTTVQKRLRQLESREEETTGR